MKRKTLQNTLFAIAGAFAVIALFTNPDHLWTASLIFALGCVQTKNIRDKEDAR